MLKTFSLRPIAPLRPYIERLWGWESDGKETIELPTLLSGTGADVFFHYRTPFSHEAGGRRHSLDSAHQTCVRRKPLHLCPSDSVGFVAVRFRAGCLHRFTPLPGADLIDQTLSASDLWGRAGRRLALDVINAPSRFQALRRLQRFLLERLRAGWTDALVERAVLTIYRACADVSIKRLASDLHIAQRQLERRFRDMTAQTPIEVRRLSRLQKVMRRLLLDRSSSLLDVIFAYGYYDQAHFIHHFAALGLGPPQQYLARARAKTHFYNPPWHVASNTDSERIGTLPDERIGR